MRLLDPIDPPAAAPPPDAPRRLGGRRVARTVLAIAAVALGWPSASASAQEEDEEEAELERAPDPEATRDADADAGDDDDDEPPLPEPDSELSTWGVGGEEPEGRFRPRGKTGKLAELEGEEDDRRREEAEGPADLPPPGYAYLDTVIGFGDQSIVGQNARGATDVTPTASFLINLGYRIGDTWGVYARFPVSTGANDGPQEPFVSDADDPDAFRQIATGAAEVGVAPIFTITRELWLPVSLGLTLPTGQGDMFPDSNSRANLGRAVVNQAAAASRGWETRALFAYQHVGFTPQVGVVYQIPDLGPGKLWLRADTKVEIMIRTGGTDPIQRPDGLIGNNQGNAVNWVLAPDASYEAFDGLLRGGLKFWVAYSTALETLVDANDPSTTVSSPDGAVLTFEPYVATHVPFVDDESVGLDAKLSVIGNAAGEIGDSSVEGAGVVGLRIGAGLFF
ncbi:MAG: hypothetical protein AAF715_32220 [Myxococcota bacterium]